MAETMPWEKELADEESGIAGLLTSAINSLQYEAKVWYN